LRDDAPVRTLPDLLKPGLDIVFVGINPGLRSAETGHYFAHPRNRFWPAVNAAGVFNPPLSPETAHLALSQRIGFTDVVKRSSSSASDIRPAEFAAGAPVLKAKLLAAAPRAVCFNGMTAYQQYMRHAEGLTEKFDFGPQSRPIGKAVAFVVPSPSPANAAFSLEDLTGWYRQLVQLRRELILRQDQTPATRSARQA
jgi:double-stranded uracil-DNA glycosylase